MIVHLVNRAGTTTFAVKRLYNNLIRCYSVQSPDVAGSSYWHHVGAEPLFYKTLGRCLDEAATKYGEREALVSRHEGVRLTFREARDRADELAAGLLAAGMRPGDRLGLWAPNHAHWYLTMMAAAKAGLVLVGINPAYRASEMEYCLNKVGVRGLVTSRSHRSQDFYEILREIAPELKHCEPGSLRSERLPSLKTVVIAHDEKLAGTYKFKEITDMATAESRGELSRIEPVVQPDSSCNIQFTSGTTGKPKAACINHFTLTNNGYHIGNRNELRGGNHRICVQVPFFHAYGVVITISAALQHGATLVLPGAAFNPKESLEAIANEKCTVIHGTPTMYVDLVAKQREVQADLGTVQIAVTGGAPCSPNLFRQMLEDLKVKQVKTVYGLTETTAVIFQTRPGDEIGKITETVGHVQDHVEIKVVDDKGDVVPFGTPGELLVRGYPNMLCYWDDDLKTNEMIGRDGWLKTGDQFVLQEDGYGKIVGRLKEMIIRGGENIFPKEIEDFVNTHPDVLETHVIGVPSERLGEEVCAFVRARDGKNIDQKTIKEYGAGKIAHFKIPRYVMQVSSFPKTASGKIQKYKLKKLYAGAGDEITCNEAPLLTI